MKITQRGFRILLFSLLIALILVALGGFGVWYAVYAPNTYNSEPVYIHIRTGSGYEEVLSQLEEKELLLNSGTFDKLAEYVGYKNNVKSGRYEIKPKMSNKELLRILASGRQSQVHLVLRGRWSKSDLIAYVSENLEADSMFLVNMLNDSAYLKPYGFTPETVLSVFLPNTYYFYWNTNAEAFFRRMLHEHKVFWNESRRKRAEELDMTPLEVNILASIVDKETSKVDEMPTIAGVYINRLKKGWLLQADPTVIYAIGNPDIRRVRGMLDVESPYNTYLYPGLPPGPICMPSLQAIKAVLNYREHNYYYFCAKEDFSGYHNFACTNDEHNINRRRYIRALEKAGIK